MKKTIIYLSFFLGLFIIGCQEDGAPLINQSDSKFSRHSTTRASLPSESLSLTNPDLIFDWENCTEITLNTMGNGVIQKRVSTPWNPYLSSTALPDEFCKDIKREDGWTMLFHTFEKEGKNEQMNYMCFYNLFTGYLKVFYYNETTSTISNMVWTMNPTNSKFNNHSIFEIPTLLTPIDKEAINNSVSEKEKELIISNAVINDKLTHGWNGFQLQISRYQEFPLDLEINTGAYGQIITEYNFNGISQSDLRGTITSVSSTDKSILNSVSQLGTDASKKVLNKLEEKIWKDNAPTGIGKLMVDATKSLISGQIGKALKQGIKFLFRRSMWNETNYQVSDIRLSQSGTITVDGKSTSEVSIPGDNLKFNLHNMLVKRNDLNTSVISPDWDSSNFKGLGTWTLDSYPIVYYNPVTRFIPTVVSGGAGSESVIEGYAAFPAIEDYELDVRFNPMIEPYIVDYDVDVDFAETDLFNDNDDSTSRIRPQSIATQLTDHVYYMSTHQERLFMRVNMGGKSFDKNLEWYYQWDDPGNRCTVAFVTVSMKVKYCGKEQTICETRAYRTESRLADGVFYPPHYNHYNLGLLNNLDIRNLSRTYLGDIPETFKP